MSKQEVIEQIQKTNRSASAEFLSSFDEAALRTYLRRLTTVLGHRGRGSTWVREGNAPAIVTR